MMDRSDQNHRARKGVSKEMEERETGEPARPHGALLLLLRRGIGAVPIQLQPNLRCLLPPHYAHPRIDS
jgi:hypothetical protein